MLQVADAVDRIVETQEDRSGSLSAFREEGRAREMREIDQRNAFPVRLERVLAIDRPDGRGVRNESADLTQEIERPGRKHAGRAESNGVVRTARHRIPLLRRSDGRPNMSRAAWLRNPCGSSRHCDLACCSIRDARRGRNCAQGEPDSAQGPNRGGCRRRILRFAVAARGLRLPGRSAAASRSRAPPRGALRAAPGPMPIRAQA